MLYQFYINLAFQCIIILTVILSVLYTVNGQHRPTFPTWLTIGIIPGKIYLRFKSQLWFWTTRRAHEYTERGHSWITDSLSGNDSFGGNECDNESLRSPFVSIYVVIFTAFHSHHLLSPCYLCCHHHRWTWLCGTYPLIRSISGLINTHQWRASHVQISHMTVCLKTSLSSTLKPGSQTVGANDLCRLCSMELCVCVSLSVSRMWSRDERVHKHLYLLNQLNDLYLHLHSE